MNVLRAHCRKRLGQFDLDLSFVAEPASTLVLVGESGAGKTTALNLLAGLVRPEGGRIELDGTVYFDDKSAVFVPPEGRSVGYVFQDYALFPHLSAFDNVAFGLRASGLAGRTRRPLVERSLHSLGISDLADRRPQQLSGGQQQRVALARALVLEPHLLLLDEPLAALDAQTRRQVRAELRRTLASLPCTTVYVTHDRFEALVFGDRIAVVEQGRIVQTGPREELLRRPRSRYVAGLMGLNLFHGTVVLHPEQAGLAELQTDDGSIHVVGAEAGSDLYVAVDPREITLHTAKPAGSAQNVFAGTVVQVEPEPPFGECARVILDTHPPLVAEVTARAVEQLRLREGLPVYASFKATAAQPYR